MCSYFLYPSASLVFLQYLSFSDALFSFWTRGGYYRIIFLAAGIAIVLNFIIEVFLKDKLSTLKSAK